MIVFREGPEAVLILAAAFVIGSYYAAESLNVRRPLKRGEPAAKPAEAPPASALSRP